MPGGHFAPPERRADTPSLTHVQRSRCRRAPAPLQCHVVDAAVEDIAPDDVPPLTGEVGFVPERRLYIWLSLFEVPPHTAHATPSTGVSA